MILNRINAQTGQGHIIVRPNLSGSRSHNIVAVGVAGFLCAVTNLPFLFAGAWLPLFYAALDIALLALALWLTFRSCQCKDVIRFTASNVIVESGRDYPLTTWSKPRIWTTVNYSHSNDTFEHPRVHLVHGGDSVRVGRRIRRVELRRLASILKKCLAWNEPTA